MHGQILHSGFGTFESVVADSALRIGIGDVGRDVPSTPSRYRSPRQSDRSSGSAAFWPGNHCLLGRTPAAALQPLPEVVALLDSLEFFCNSTDSRAVPGLRELAVLPGPVSFASSLGRYTLIGSRVSVLRCERVRIGKRSLSQSRCIPSNAPLKQYGDLQVSLRPASRGCMRSDISGEPASLVFTHTVSRASSERHEMGTLGLQETARRLRECVRACCRRV